MPGPVGQKMKRGFRIVLCVEHDIEAGLGERQAKQLAVAGAVFYQEDGGVRHHYKRRYQQGMCRARR